MAINSNLLTAAMLGMRSSVFPEIVQAACWIRDMPYDDNVLRFVATRPAILNALQVTDRGIDAAIEGAVVGGFDLDTAVSLAVQQYQSRTPS